MTEYHYALHEGGLEVRTGGGKDSLLITQKVGSVCILTGTIIFGAATLLHPPTFDPRAPVDVVRAIAHQPSWSAMHWAAAAGILLLALGLTALSPVIHSTGRIGLAPFATGMTWVSLALWLWVFTMEALGWPALTTSLEHLSANQLDDLPVLSLLRTLWAGTLGLGYVAAALMEMATFLWAVDMVETKVVPTLVGRGILILAPFAVAGLVPAWQYPNLVYLSLAPSGLLFLWYIVLAVFLWPKKHE